MVPIIFAVFWHIKLGCEPFPASLNSTTCEDMERVKGIMTASGGIKKMLQGVKEGLYLLADNNTEIYYLQELLDDAESG